MANYELAHLILEATGGAAVLLGLAVTAGKLLSKVDSMNSSMKSMAGDLKEMRKDLTTHHTSLVEVTGEVKALKDWKDSLIEDARTGSGMFARLFAKKR